MKKIQFALVCIALLTSCKMAGTARFFRQGNVAAQEFRAEIPFEFRLGLIILKVKIEGKEYDFLVDTGAPNIISQELATLLKLSSGKHQRARDSQGKKSSLELVVLPEMDIGGVRFQNTGVAIADIKQSVEIACMKIDGLIGANLMRKAIWEFDYQRKVVIITHSRSSLNIPSESFVIPFRQTITGTPVIDIHYAGITDKDVIFDMGSNGDFSSEGTVHGALRKSGNASASIYSFGNNSVGLFGETAPDTTWYMMVPEITLGNLTISQQVISFSEKKARTVGTKFFDNHRLIIDWSTEEILMIPVEKYDNSQLKSFGFTPKFTGNQLQIGLIFQDSEAQKQGFSLGDQILEVNGTDYRVCTVEQWCDIIENTLVAEDRQTMTIILLKDGQEKSYTLERKVLLE